MSQESVIGHGLLGEDSFANAGNGRRLRIMVDGDGDDLVVLESGLGVSGLYWGPVHETIARRARVVAYERAGFGASTPDRDHPRDLEHLVSDLESVIDTIAHRRLVLVGHSWGGPIVRAAAARCVAAGAPPVGLVLVDQSDEHASLYFSRTARWSNALQGALTVPLARLRLLAPLARTMITELPRPVRDAAVAASSSVDAARATADELAHVVDGLGALRDSPPDLGGIGISVISGQRRTWLDTTVRARLVSAHRETVRQHPGARFVPAQDSGHIVPMTDPGLIASEALSFLA